MPQGLHQKSGTLLPLNGRVDNAKYDYDGEVSDLRDFAGRFLILLFWFNYLTSTSKKKK